MVDGNDVPPNPLLFNSCVEHPFCLNSIIFLFPCSFYESCHHIFLIIHIFISSPYYIFLPERLFAKQNQQLFSFFFFECGYFFFIFRNGFSKIVNVS